MTYRLVLIRKLLYIYTIINNNDMNTFKTKTGEKIITTNEPMLVGDLILENGKSIVKMIKDLGEDLIWESLDGKSSACDGKIEFKKVSKN